MKHPEFHPEGDRTPEHPSNIVHVPYHEYHANQELSEEISGKQHHLNRQSYFRLDGSITDLPTKLSESSTNKYRQLALNLHVIMSIKPDENSQVALFSKEN